jgi:hypothetical protein
VFFSVFPSLEFDTFVTIGKRTSVGDETTLAPGRPGFGASSLTGTNLAWFVTPGAPQAIPDADGRVLIGQFSTQDGCNLSGTVLLQWDDADGNTTQQLSAGRVRARARARWRCSAWPVWWDGVTGGVDQVGRATGWHSGPGAARSDRAWTMWPWESGPEPARRGSIRPELRTSRKNRVILSRR